MKRGAWTLVLGLAAAAAAAQSSETTPTHSDSAAKPTPAPFYRQYLVPGNPLDDKIVEQEHRVDESPDDANLRNDFGNLLALRRFPKEAAEQYEIALQARQEELHLGLQPRPRARDRGQALGGHLGVPEVDQEKARIPAVALSPRPGATSTPTSSTTPSRSTPRRCGSIPPCATSSAIRSSIDSELIYLASLVNYQRDMAVASMDDAHVYFDNDRFRKLPVDRAISSKEVESDEAEPEPTPRNVGSAGSAGATGVAEPPVRRGQRAPAPGAPGAEMPQPGAVRGAPRPAPGAARTKTPPRAVQPFQPAPAPTPPPETVEPPPEVSPEAPPPESAPEPATTPGPPQEVEPS